MKNKIMLGTSFLLALTILTACGDTSNSDSEGSTQKEESETMDHSAMDHGNMNHSSNGEVPEGLKAAENPKFEVGSHAIIKTDHMEGMNGSEATIVGAYDTTVYTVTYTPTTGGEQVKNHKWVIHEELEGVDTEPLEPGAEVTLNADHMEGMKGATATVDSVENTTVYMVDYTSSTGEKVTNHKWVTENELSNK
ncbi:YdhK family protein [Lysinibacillus sp. BW-2-10]|uniref:YdhK family protein n=1 Tax=Lysinibacillus sp. BW-2-10 TaxID=2590030 RepID=UPI00117EA967|nr:YdhK family protein [Lysinibacillus sp. BW-2-10]TSI07667.1 DUF1541 domain-containing protein [Lysinibacillus sp. BW-2-10]